jgi:hypothetical protein
MSEIITVVAGIPRSGTSMMMRMLHAGGMPIFAGNLLSYETDMVQKLPHRWQWLKACEGKVVKILDPHVYVPLGVAQPTVSGIVTGKSRTDSSHEGRGL